MALLQRDVVESGRITYALFVETREAALRAVVPQAAEEALEGCVQIDECLLTDVRRDLI